MKQNSWIRNFDDKSSGCLQERGGRWVVELLQLGRQMAGMGSAIETKDYNTGIHTEMIAYKKA